MALNTECKALLDKIYVAQKDQLKMLFGNKTTLDISEWTKLIISQMIIVEKLNTSGELKQKILIEFIVMVINELQIPIEDKTKLETMLRNIAPSIIESIIYASKNINITNKNCFGCF